MAVSFRPIPRAAMIAGLIAALVSAAHSADEIMAFSYAFTPGEVSYAVQRDGTELPRFPGDSLAGGRPGRPWMPSKRIYVRLPDGWENAAVSVAAERELIRDDIAVTPRQNVSATDGSDPAPWVDRDAAAYASAVRYPASDGQLLGIHRMRGQKFASILLNPLSYVAARNELYLATKIDVKVSRAPAKALAPARGAGANGAKFAAGGGPGIFSGMLDGIVENPAGNDAAPAAPKFASTGGDGAGAPRAKCSYLIITSPALKTAFQRLADYRALNGETPEVVTTDWIDANYDGARPDGGSDIQTKIRNCIKDYAENKDTYYVCLGGDDTVVPDRDTYVYANGGAYSCINMPTDLYYSDLDGTWDANANGVYGERVWEEAAGDEYVLVADDEMDFAPDVIVGRIPVRTSAQAAQYLFKLFNYEEGVRTKNEFLNKVYLGGAKAWDYVVNGVSDPWVYPPAGEKFHDGLGQYAERESASDAEVWLRRVWRDDFDKGYGLRPYFFLDTVTSSDADECGDYPQTAANVNAEMSRGHHYCLYYTHGHWNRIALEGSGRQYAADMASLTGRVDFIYTAACLTAFFDGGNDPCFMESAIRNRNGGAVGYMGCSREGWGYQITLDPWFGYYCGSELSLAYGRDFFHAVLDQGVERFGAAAAYAKAMHIGDLYWADAMQWLMQGINIFGDPLARLYAPQYTVDPYAEVFSVNARAINGTNCLYVLASYSSGEYAMGSEIVAEVSFDDVSFTNSARCGECDYSLGDDVVQIGPIAVPDGAGACFARVSIVNAFGRNHVSDVFYTGNYEADKYPLALDAPDLEFQSSSNAEWRVTSDNVVGGSALESPYVARGGHSSLSTAVVGPGTMSFYWSMCGYDTNDYFRAYVGGNEVTNITGYVDWTQVFIDIPAGEHAVEWRFERGSGNPVGWDGARLDCVSFPATGGSGKYPRATISRAGSADDSITVASRIMSLGDSSIGSLSIECSTNIMFECDVTTVPAGLVREDDLVCTTIAGLDPNRVTFFRAKVQDGDRISRSGNVTLFGDPPAGYTVSGRVVTEAGAPAFGVVVGFDGAMYARTDTNGYYSALIEAPWSGAAYLVGEPTASPASTNLVAAPGESATLDFTVSGVYFVSADATGVGDGSSWSNAFTDVNAALQACEFESGYGLGLWHTIAVYDSPKLAQPGGMSISGESLALAITNALSGFYYTVYAADDPGGEFRSVKCVLAPGYGEMSIPGVPAAGDRKFYRITVGSEPVPDDTPFAP